MLRDTNNDMQYPAVFLFRIKLLTRNGLWVDKALALMRIPTLTASSHDIEIAA